MKKAIKLTLSFILAIGMVSCGAESVDTAPEVISPANSGIPPLEEVPEQKFVTPSLIFQQITECRIYSGYVTTGTDIVNYERKAQVVYRRNGDLIDQFLFTIPANTNVSLQHPLFENAVEDFNGDDVTLKVVGLFQADGITPINGHILREVVAQVDDNCYQGEGPGLTYIDLGFK